MTALGERAAPLSGEHAAGDYEPTLDWSSWRPDTRRLNAAALVVALCVALGGTAGAYPRTLAGLLLLQVVLAGLPWRLPRVRRSGRSFWLETAALLLPGLAAVVLAIVLRPPWLTSLATWWYYPLAVGCGLGLLVGSGVRMRSVLDGELAFALGPTTTSHARARALASAIGPFGEEALFRTPVLIVTASTPLNLLAGAAFVASHHIPRGTNGRGSVRASVVEIAGAAVLLALTVASGSVYPALLVHLLNNSASVVVELQRDHSEGETWS